MLLEISSSGHCIPVADLSQASHNYFPSKSGADLSHKLVIIQRASEASEADSQSCSIEISDIYIYICRYVCVRQKISPALLIT